ncbi:MAG: RNA polymerase sigma factor [Isosphaeraceae bacterium]
MLGPFTTSVEKGPAIMSSAGRIDIGLATNDERLAAARAGDASARWGALEACRAYLQLVARRDCWSNGPGEPETSDLVQDTMLDGWRGFAGFKGRTPGQLRAWLKAILIHSSIRARQRRLGAARLDSEGVGGPMAATLTPASVRAQRGDSREAIDAAMNGMPDHYRMAIAFRLWDDLSFVEIGSRLAISEESARKLYGRAIHRLRELMGPGHDPG